MQEQIQDQEIDLREYINVMIKRKKIILSVFFISVIIAAVISSFMPKVYETAAVIQNGNINGPLIAKTEIEEIIKSQDMLSSAVKNTEIDIANITSLKGAIKVEDIKNSNFFRLSVKYKGADTPIKICQGIIDSYFAFSRPIYQERIKLLDSQMKELDNQLKNVKNDMQNLRKIINSFSLPQEFQESNEAILETRIRLISALSNYRNRLSSLTNRRDELNLIRIKAKEFKVIDGPLRQKSLVKPKKRQNVIFAGVISLVFGVFLAFFFEFWEKSK